jgi:VIT1/CCC1 family predicted Fe2+/Mn2+ transporter
MRQQLHRLPERARPRLTKSDWLGALGLCLLSFLSTFPIVVPFLFIGDARLALRISNAVAIAMLFLCGYVFGRCAGFRPVAMGVSMVALGCVLVGVAIALGG